MNQLLKLGLIFFAGLGLTKLFSSDNDKGISGIPREDIDDKYLEQVNRNTNEGDLKRTLTNRINQIIAQCKKFKVGETGSPEGRRKSYVGYSKMYLLCKCTSEEYIDKLEHYYNEKFFNHPKNDNINQGSAGKMSSPDGNFYLYIVSKE